MVKYYCINSGNHKLTVGKLYDLKKEELKTTNVYKYTKYTTINDIGIEILVIIDNFKSNREVQLEKLNI